MDRPGIGRDVPERLAQERLSFGEILWKFIRVQEELDLPHRSFEDNFPSRSKRFRRERYPFREVIVGRDAIECRREGAVDCAEQAPDRLEGLELWRLQRPSHQDAPLEFC